MKSNTMRIALASALCIMIGINIGIAITRDAYAVEIETLCEAETTRSEEKIEVAETEYIETECAETEPLHIETDVEEQPSVISLGEFKLTAYCACNKCCGKTDGITATGTQATEGRTIAVDPAVIPFGTTVIINGEEYIAEDCGGAINDKRIDVYFDSHTAALEFGVQYAEVFAEEV